jgi:hypothetical protein
MAERHARQRKVVDILPAAAQQPRVLEPRHALTDRKLTHCSPLMLKKLSASFRTPRSGDPESRSLLGICIWIPGSR